MKKIYIQFLIISLLFNSACSNKIGYSKANNTCEDVQLQVLGAGGPEINDGLASASYLVWIKGKARIMVDAGGGSSLNFERSGANFNDLQAILLTHLHVDHSAALPVYVKAGYFTGREQALPIFGPDGGDDFPSTEKFVAALFSDQQKSAYPYLSDNFRLQSSTDYLVHPESVSPNNKIWTKQLSEEIQIKSINVNHGRVPAIAWRVNLGECAITISGDMNGSSGNLQKLAKNTDLLVANNAIPVNAKSFAKRLHMTPDTIGQIAEEAEVQQLVLAHFMRRTINRKKETLQLIRQLYSGKIVLAEELTFVELD